MGPSPGELRLGVSVGVVVMGQIQPQSGRDRQGDKKQEGGQEIALYGWRAGQGSVASWPPLNDSHPQESQMEIIWTQSLVFTRGRELISICVQETLDCNYIMFRAPWKGVLKISLITGSHSTFLCVNLTCLPFLVVFYGSHNKRKQFQDRIFSRCMSVCCGTESAEQRVWVPTPEPLIANCGQGQATQSL